MNAASPTPKSAFWRGGPTPAPQEGDPKQLPPLPTFSDGWHLGKPDVVLEMPTPFEVTADGPDSIRLYALPIPFAKVKYLRGLEFRPGNRRVVHHANLYVDSTGTLRKQAKDGIDARGLGLGVEQAGLDSLQGLIGAWVPGTTPRLLPNGVGQPLPANTDLIVGIHYHPNGKAESDRSSVGLYLSDTPGNTFTATWPAAICPPLKNTHLLDIPAGAKDHTFSVTSVPLPADARAYGIYAHGHFLMRRVKVTAVLPDGKSIELLQINNWDFNWQDRYYFTEPVKLPKGTKLDAIVHYDNSADNPQNPNRPPKDVHFGPKTDDEMFSIITLLLPERVTEIPAEGIPIPEWASFVRKRLDKNGDGRLSAEECQQPQAWCDCSLKELAAHGRGTAAAKCSPTIQARLIQAESNRVKPKMKAGSSCLRAASAFPRAAKVIREKYDTNKDGRLTQNELDAMPDEIRIQVEKVLRKQPEQLECRCRCKWASNRRLRQSCPLAKSPTPATLRQSSSNIARSAIGRAKWRPSHC